MRLQTKLFLSIGLLLLLVTLIMFFLPRYLIRRDVAYTANEVKAILKQDAREIEKNQKAWLEVKLTRLRAHVDALLFLINDSEELSEAIPLRDAASSWVSASRMVSLNPNIGLVQIDEGERTALVISRQKQLFPAKSVDVKEDLPVIEVEGKVYLGAAIPTKEKSSEEFYALIPLESASKELKELLGIVQEAKATPDLLKALKTLRDLPLPKADSMRDEAQWADKVALLQLLAPLYAEGVKVHPSLENVVPAGVARVDAAGRGEAILSADFFAHEPLFDAAAYYRTSPPPEGGAPVAQSARLIRVGSDVYLANTLKLGNTYVTLGAPLGLVGKELAQASHQTVILYVQKEMLLFPPSGQQETFDALTPPETGKPFQFGGKTYAVTRFDPLPRLPISFYVLSSQIREKSVLDSLTTLQTEVARKMSLQMIAVMLVSLGLALFLLNRIARSFTRPIVQLAGATEGVASGKYSEIVLPEVGKGADEIAVLTRAFQSMIDGLVEREKIRGVLNKVVSKDVADEILKSTIHLGGEDRVISMLFSDIRGFTKMTENFSPQQTIEMLNAYMTKMSHVIEGEGGVIDKYVGDEIMALYGAPSPHPDHAVRAVSSAMLMIETLKKWNDERAAHGQPPVEMGVGIHTGLVVAGNMGAEDRLNYTVLGANVNLAARLGQAAEPGQVIISEAVLNEPKVSDSFHVKPLDPISLKGFSEPIKIYQISGFKWGES